MQSRKFQQNLHYNQSKTKVKHLKNQSKTFKKPKFKFQLVNNNKIKSGTFFQKKIVYFYFLGGGYQQGFNRGGGYNNHYQQQNNYNGYKNNSYLNNQTNRGEQFLWNSERGSRWETNDALCKKKVLI